MRLTNYLTYQNLYEIKLTTHEPNLISDKSYKKPMKPYIRLSLEQTNESYIRLAL